MKPSRIAHLVACAGLLTACGGPRMRGAASQQSVVLCPSTASQFFGWPQILQRGFPHALAESLAATAERPSGLTRDALATLRAQFQLDTSVAAQAVLFLAFREAAMKDLNLRLLILPRVLGRLIGDGQIAPQAMFVGPWRVMPEGEREFMMEALGQAGARPPAQWAEEHLACLELDRLAPLFVPNSATTLMDLSVDPTAFIMALRALENGGPSGRDAVGRILKLAKVDPPLYTFVTRVVRGLQLEKWQKMTPKF